MPVEIIESSNSPVRASGSALPGDIRESVAISGVNAVAGQPAALSNLSYANAAANVNLSQQNAVAMQQAIGQVGVSALGKAINLVGDLQPMEAVAVTKLDTGNDIAQQISDLKAATEFSPDGAPKPRRRKVPSLVQKDGETLITLSKETLPAQISFTDSPKVFEIVERGGK
jgi:hypothetical protein